MKHAARLILLVVIGPVIATPAQAQLFRKKPAAPAAKPEERVPALVSTLKSDSEERHRVQAAEELREFDPRAYPEIIPALVAAALSDARPNVRLEVITSLGKIRPISQDAGQALEKAAASDDNLRVRVHARTTLWKYQLAGYSSGRKDAKRSTDEPPLYDRPKTAPPSDSLPLPPPSADPVTPPRPLPDGPGFSTAVPMRPRAVAPAPDPVIIEDDLPPPPPRVPLPSGAPPALPPTGTPPPATPPSSTPLPPAAPLP